MMSVSADGGSDKLGTERRRRERDNRKVVRETLHQTSQQQSAAVVQRPQRMNPKLWWCPCLFLQRRHRDKTLTSASEIS